MYEFDTRVKSNKTTETYSLQKLALLIWHLAIAAAHQILNHIVKGFQERKTFLIK